MSKDKIEHGLVGCGVGLFVGLIAYLMQQDKMGNVADSAAWAGVFVAIIVAAMAGVIKEWCDNNTDCGKWDWLDWAATVIGGVVAALIIIAIHFGKG